MSAAARNRTGLIEWRELTAMAAAMRFTHLRRLAADSARDEVLVRRAGPVLLDCAKQKIDLPVREVLFRLARVCGLPRAIEDLFAGRPVNNTEGRPALHTALRLPRGKSLLLDGRDIVPDIHASLDRVRDVVARVHSGQWRGFSGRSITDVVNIGVGGSDLGPFMASQALAEFAPPEAARLRLHFVSSIDGTQLAGLLDTVRPESTLFIVSSKSFGTQDTLANAATALAWMEKACGDRTGVLQHHFIGVSAHSGRMTAWGIPTSNQIAFWEWVGGRFSLWSAIGLPIALRIGMANFEAMLAGGHFMDEHFRVTPLENNLPVLLGLVGVWNATFLDIRAHTILPYDARLKFFLSYLTQLEMESNGKSVNRDGKPVPYGTCPVLWGDVGPNAQHAFYQLLHQGTQPVSSDFIAPIRRYERYGESPSARAALQAQHRLALANCLAQTRVLMMGDASIEGGQETDGYRRYRGDQPSSTILVDELTPFTLGALIALYEHKVYVMSVIWDINPFDQWGVELGKKIADRMLAALDGGAEQSLDGPTRRLLAEIRSRGGEAS